jgi:hypothetical protein
MLRQDAHAERAAMLFHWLDAADNVAPADDGALVDSDELRIALRQVAFYELTHVIQGWRLKGRKELSFARHPVEGLAETFDVKRSDADDLGFHLRRDRAGWGLQQLLAEPL